MILPCDCPSPAHCLEATGGEQGLTADELEIARLRRERIEQEATNLEMGGEIARLRRELDEALSLRDRLSTIVDEAFGPQEVLGMDALLSRLEHLLTERARQHEEVRRELDEWREWADYHSSWALIDAERPPDAELRARIGELCDVATGEEWAQTHGARDEALAKLELEKKKRGADWRLIGEGNDRIDRIEKSRDLIARQRDLMERERAKALMDLEATRVALRDLIDSVTAAKTRNTIVLRDLDAARAVLGGKS